jgi:hypothetical protein
MRTATALTITAVGAIFAFAITAHPSWLNLQVVGWVLILTGVCGLVIPRRGRGWLRRTVLVKGTPDFTKVRHAKAEEPTPAISGTVHSGNETAAEADDGRVERESIVEFTEK